MKNKLFNKTDSKTKWNLLSFKKITSVDESVRLIKDIFWAFMGVGLLLLILGIILSFFGVQDLYFGFIIDGFVYVVLSLIFFFKRSRIAAVLLLLVAITSVIMTTLSMLGLNKGGSNILLAIILLIAAIHGVRATFAYHILNKNPS